MNELQAQHTSSAFALAACSGGGAGPAIPSVAKQDADSAILVDSNGFSISATRLDDTTFRSRITGPDGVVVLSGQYSKSVNATGTAINHAFALTTPSETRTYAISIDVPNVSSGLVDGVSFKINDDGTTSAIVSDANNVGYTFHKSPDGSVLSIHASDGRSTSSVVHSMANTRVFPVDDKRSTLLKCQALIEADAAVVAWAATAAAVGLLTGPAGAILIPIGAVGTAAGAIGAFALAFGCHP